MDGVRRGRYWAPSLLLLGLSACAQNHGSVRQSLPPDQAVIDKLTAHRVAGSAEAEAFRLSLPLPRSMNAPLVMRDRPTQVQPVGFWPESDGRRSVRRHSCPG